VERATGIEPAPAAWESYNWACSRRVCLVALAWSGLVAPGLTSATGPWMARTVVPVLGVTGVGWTLEL